MTFAASLKQLGVHTEKWKCLCRLSNGSLGWGSAFSAVRRGIEWRVVSVAGLDISPVLRLRVTCYPARRMTRSRINRLLSNIYHYTQRETTYPQSAPRKTNRAPTNQNILSSIAIRNRGRIYNKALNMISWHTCYFIRNYWKLYFI